MTESKFRLLSNLFSIASMAEDDNLVCPIVIRKSLRINFNFENDLSPLQFATNIQRYIFDIIITFENASFKSFSLS